MEPLLLDRLLQVADLFQRDMTRAFDGTGLTPARVHLLWVLARSGPSTQQSLAVACGVSPRNITGLVDGLEASGHVRRTPHPTDRRAVLVELTATATAMMNRMQREHVELNDTLMSAIAPADRASVERGLSALIAKLTDLVDEASTAPTAERRP
ncbi:MAG TPA: MarR family transcriptional regulator [Microbacterium sp.]|nr:MarR family transcriptional regulator [Microbacterium sp.]